ncbi:MAG: hypothetical protein JO062_07610 [Bryobacterales bacterium]|nr:hypothetical protein [Bryobacterales bacterium]
MARVRKQLNGNGDEYVNGLVNQASRWLSEIESIFFARLREEQEPRKSIRDEYAIIHAAEDHLNALAVPLVNHLRDLAAKDRPSPTPVTAYPSLAIQHDPD